MNKYGLLFVLAIVCLSCNDQKDSNAYQQVEEWEPLFNGADMTGWEAKFVDRPIGDNYKNTFVIEDSLLKASYIEYDTFKNEFGHLFFNKKYSYYRLRAEYRLEDVRINGTPDWAYGNNGLMLHSQSAQSMGLNQAFPISLEMQLLAADGQGERPNGNLCTPGTHVNLADTLFTTHCINSTSKTYPLGQWVKVQAVVLGDSIIQHIIENDTVISYSKPIIGGAYAEGAKPEVKIDNTPIRDGYIAIQAEGHPISFKKIEVLNLCGCMDPKAKNYKSYYLKADNSCIY